MFGQTTCSFMFLVFNLPMKHLKNPSKKQQTNPKNNLIEPTNPNAVTLCRAECTETSAEMKILVFSLWRWIAQSSRSSSVLLGTLESTLLLDALGRTLLQDTLSWHSCWTLLQDTLAGHFCWTLLTLFLDRTLLLDTLSWHFFLTLLLDTLAGHSYLTLFLDTLC